MPAGREDEARAFYARLLGIPEIPKPPELAKRGGAWFENGAVRVHTSAWSRTFARRGRPNSRPARPGQLRGLVLCLREAGVDVVDDEPLPGYDRVFTADPFGNRLELLEPLR